MLLAGGLAVGAHALRRATRSAGARPGHRASRLARWVSAVARGAPWSARRSWSASDSPARLRRLRGSSRQSSSRPRCSNAFRRPSSTGFRVGERRPSRWGHGRGRRCLDGPRALGRRRDRRHLRRRGRGRRSSASSGSVVLGHAELSARSPTVDRRRSAERLPALHVNRERWGGPHASSSGGAPSSCSSTTTRRTRRSGSTRSPSPPRRRRCS